VATVVAKRAFDVDVIMFTENILRLFMNNINIVLFMNKDIKENLY
jgi:hypothetical protein